MTGNASAIVVQLAGVPEAALSARGRAVLQTLVDHVSRYPRTPVRVFDVPVAGRKRRIRLKLEGESPWHSVKGRTAIGLLASLTGRMTTDSTVVESTSGNLGVALAGLCRANGVRFIAVVDDRLPSVMRRRIAEQGADVVVADHATAQGDRLAARMQRVDAIAADPRILWPNQYDNPANPLTHELWTGPEFLEQVPQAQAIFVGASTGGTLAGCLRAARACGRPTKVVGVDVEGSRVFGGPAGERVLTGIGASRVSSHVNPAMCDAVETVIGWDSVRQCRRWKGATGLGLGGSSGAVLAAAMRHLSGHDDLTDVACLCPDLGDNYADTIYHDRWVADHFADAWTSEREPGV